MNIQKVDPSEASVSVRMQEATLLGTTVAKIINAAVKRANKALQKSGYEVTVEFHFHEINVK